MPLPVTLAAGVPGAGLAALPLPLLVTLPGVPGEGLAALPLPLLATLPGFPSAGLPGVPGPCCRREGRAQGDMEVEEVLKGCAYMLTFFCYPSGWQSAGSWGIANAIG